MFVGWIICCCCSFIEAETWYSCSKVTVQCIMSYCFCTRGVNLSVHLLFLLTPPPNTHKQHRQRTERLERQHHLRAFHTGLSKGGRADTCKIFGHCCRIQQWAHLAPTSGQQGGRQAGQPTETSGGPVRGQLKPFTLHFLLQQHLA